MRYRNKEINQGVKKPRCSCHANIDTQQNKAMWSNDVFENVFRDREHYEMTWFWDANEGYACYSFNSPRVLGSASYLKYDKLLLHCYAYAYCAIFSCRLLKV